MTATVPASARPTVLVVDDHAVFADCLALVLRTQGFAARRHPDRRLRHERVLEAVADTRPDVVLLDLYLGTAGLGTTLIAPMKELPTTVLVLSASQDRRLLAECLEEGAAGPRKPAAGRWRGSPAAKPTSSTSS